MSIFSNHTNEHSKQNVALAENVWGFIRVMFLSIFLPIIELAQAWNKGAFKRSHGAVCMLFSNLIGLGDHGAYR
ncbi:MAG: hypothetical protein KA715_00210 [Xanthomonadaceae bacterium]|nr:hypothetical protein [Xanthomonadaceae bacterium]